MNMMKRREGDVKKKETKKVEKKAPKKLRVFNWLSMQAARFCDSDDSRYQLGSVAFHGRKTVATDGRQLVIIDAPDVHDVAAKRGLPVRVYGPAADTVAKALPKGRRKADIDDGQAFMLPATAVKRLARDMKKKKRGEDHYCLVDSREANAEKKRVSCIIGQTDGVSISELHAVEGHYPKYEKVIPQEKPTVVIELNPEYLERICKLMREVCCYGGGWTLGRMTLSVYGSGDPLKIEAKNEGTGQTALAVLMPLEPSDETKAEEEKKSRGKEGEKK